MKHNSIHQIAQERLRVQLIGVIAHAIEHVPLPDDWTQLSAVVLFNQDMPSKDFILGPPYPNGILLTLIDIQTTTDPHLITLLVLRDLIFSWHLAKTDGVTRYKAKKLKSCIQRYYMVYNRYAATK